MYVALLDRQERALCHFYIVPGERDGAARCTTVRFARVRDAVAHVWVDTAHLRQRQCPWWQGTFLASPVRCRISNVLKQLSHLQTARPAVVSDSNGPASLPVQGQ